MILAAALAAAASTSGCILRREAPALVAADPAVVADTQAYVAAAAASDLFEITTSQLALQRTQNSEVRAYATALIAHHTMTSNAALVAARSAGATPPPPVLSEEKLALVQQLQSQVGFDFDRAYIDGQLPSHAQALELHSRYRRSGAEPRLRRTAAAAVPVVIEHFEQARRLQGRLAAGL